MRRAEYTTHASDSRALPFLPANHFHQVITSPSYFGQRVYGESESEIGTERDIRDYVSAVADVAGEMYRVLRDDGTFWLNLGDKMVRNQLVGVPWRVAAALKDRGWYLRQEIIWAKAIAFGESHAENVRKAVRRAAKAEGLDKDAAARVAAAVEAQCGSCMPSSADNRFTTSHEQVFIFSKRPTDYYFDIEAVKEKGKDWGPRDRTKWKYRQGGNGAPHNGCEDNNFAEKGRNLRSVWTIGTQPVKGMSHFAPFPVNLVRPMILAGTSAAGCCAKCGAPLVRIVEKEKLLRSRPNEYTKRTGEKGTGNKCANTVDGTATRTAGWRRSCECNDSFDPVPCRIIDPFGGSGTTAVAGVPLGRDVTIIDLYPNYLIEAAVRIERAINGNANDDHGENPAQTDDGGAACEAGGVVETA